jgi:ECF sigma factor
VAAQAMRQILVDYARSQRAGKRVGGALKVELDDHVSVTSISAQPQTSYGVTGLNRWCSFGGVPLFNQEKNRQMSRLMRPDATEDVVSLEG